MYKNLIDIPFLIRVFNAVIYYLGIANFAFGGCLNSVRRCEAQFTFSHGLATCSFGGLTRDVILTPVITGAIVTPALFKSAESWIVTIVMVILFRIICRKNKSGFFDNEGFTVPFLVLDALALGNFTMIGVSTAVQLGLTSPVIQLLYGIVTATGGGVFSTLVWTRNRKQLLCENIWYYTTAAFSSGIACFGLSCGFNQEALCLACSAVCAAAYLLQKAVAIESDRTVSQCCKCRMIYVAQTRLTLKKCLYFIRRMPGVRSVYYTLGLRRKFYGLSWSC